MNAIIDVNDVVYATIIYRGVVVSMLKLTGMNSVSMILQTVKTEAKQCIGMVTLKLRNYSKGWTQNRQIIMESTLGQSTSIQLSLF